MMRHTIGGRVDQALLQKSMLNAGSFTSPWTTPGITPAATPQGTPSVQHRMLRSGTSPVAVWPVPDSTGSAKLAAVEQEVADLRQEMQQQREDAHAELAEQHALRHLLAKAEGDAEEAARAIAEVADRCQLEAEASAQARQALSTVQQSELSAQLSASRASEELGICTSELRALQLRLSQTEEWTCREEEAHSREVARSSLELAELRAELTSASQAASTSSREVYKFRAEVAHLQAEQNRLTLELQLQRQHESEQQSQALSHLCGEKCGSEGDLHNVVAAKSEIELLQQSNEEMRQQLTDLRARCVKLATLRDRSEAPSATISANRVAVTRVHEQHGRHCQAMARAEPRRRKRRWLGLAAGAMFLVPLLPLLRSSAVEASSDPSQRLHQDSASDVQGDA